MSTVAAPVPTQLVSTPKKTKTQKKSVSKPKTPSSHPTYGDMIRKAVSELKEKKGSSRAAILKYILQHFKVGTNFVQINAHIRQALKRGVISGALKQTKGVGAAGSFRLGEQKATKKKVVAKKPKTAKSPKKTTKKVVKKSSGASPKKPKAAKAKKPKAAAAAPTAVSGPTVAPTSAKPAKKAVSSKKVVSPKKKSISPKKVITKKPKVAKSPKKKTASKKLKSPAKAK